MAGQKGKDYPGVRMGHNIEKGGDQQPLFMWDVPAKLAAMSQLKIALGLTQMRLLQEWHNMDQYGGTPHVHGVEGQRSSEPQPFVLGFEETTFNAKGDFEKPHWLAMVDIMPLVPIVVAGLDPQGVRDLCSGILTDPDAGEKIVRDALRKVAESVSSETGQALSAEKLLRQLSAGNWVGGGPLKPVDVKATVTPIGSRLSEVDFEIEKRWEKTTPDEDVQMFGFAPSYVRDLQFNVVKGGRVMKGPIQQMLFGMWSLIETSLPTDKQMAAKRRFAQLFGRRTAEKVKEQYSINPNTPIDVAVSVHIKRAVEILSNGMIDPGVEFGTTAEPCTLERTAEGRLEFKDPRVGNLLRLWYTKYTTMSKLYNDALEASGSGMGPLTGNRAPFFVIDTAKGEKVPLSFTNPNQSYNSFLESLLGKEKTVVIAPATLALAQYLFAVGVMLPAAGSTYSKPRHESEFLAEQVGNNPTLSLPYLAKLGLLPKPIYRTHPHAVENLPDGVVFVIPPSAERVLTLAGVNRRKKGEVTGAELREAYNNDVLGDLANIFNSPDATFEVVLDRLEALVTSDPSRLEGVQQYLLHLKDKNGKKISEAAFWFPYVKELIAAREGKFAQYQLDLEESNLLGWFAASPVAEIHDREKGIASMMANPIKEDKKTEKTILRFESNGPALALSICNQFGSDPALSGDAAVLRSLTDSKDIPRLRVALTRLITSHRKVAEFIYDSFVQPLHNDREAKQKLSQAIEAILERAMSQIPEDIWKTKIAVAKQYANAKTWDEVGNMKGGQVGFLNPLVSIISSQLLNTGTSESLNILVALIDQADPQAHELLVKIEEGKSQLTNGKTAQEARKKASLAAYEATIPEFYSSVVYPLLLMKSEVTRSERGIDYANSRPSVVHSWIVSPEWTSNMFSPEKKGTAVGHSVDTQYFEVEAISVRSFDVNGNKLLFYEDKHGIFAGDLKDGQIRDMHPQAEQLRAKLLENIGENDSVIVLTHPYEEGSDAMMRVFERDGSESMSCGNAALLAAYLYSKDMNLNGQTVTLSNLEGSPIPLSVKNGDIKVGISSSITDIAQTDIEKDITSARFLEPIRRHIDTMQLVQASGEPHFVVGLSDFDWHAASIHFHDSPVLLAEAIQRVVKKNVGYDVNIAFVTKIRGQRVEAYQFERGVQDFTGSCGTGTVSIAAALGLPAVKVEFKKPDNANRVTGSLSVSSEDSQYWLESDRVHVTEQVPGEIKLEKTYAH